MKDLLCVLLSALLVINVLCSGDSQVSPEVHQLEKIWWGQEYLEKFNDTSIKPFEVQFRDGLISDLKYRLHQHRPFTPPLKGVGFQYGFNTDYLENWVDYWANKYDFNAREAFLNKFPQYKTNIQGLDIHFLWVKPKVPENVEVLPLLLLHGWPGTVRELYESIPYLTEFDNGRNFVLEIIAPSLPGFGFSDGAIRPGLGAVEMGVVIRNLMRRLGFHKFYIQGGDWGSRVGSAIATLYPEEVLGYHTNFAFSLSPVPLAIWIAGQYDQNHVNPAVADRLYPITKHLRTLMTGLGYMHLQATKPDSLGVAMSDSPAGLLAYILQLVSSGTHKANPLSEEGGLHVYDPDGLLDILTVTWVSNSFTTSCRIYAESMNLRSWNSSLESKPTPVPTWTIHAKHEIIYQTPAMLRFKYPNLLHSTVLPDGGHFLAFEKPKVFADDVLQAIGAFRAWHAKNYYNKEEL